MADRRNMTTRDMVVCMAVLVGALLFVVGAYGGFSFAPGGAKDAPPPATDVTTGFTRAGPALNIPVVVPKRIPSDWEANSFLLKTPENYGKDVVPLVRGGWLTGSGNYITVIQSGASPADVLGQEIGNGLNSTVSITEAGVNWEVYPGVRNEVAWVRQANGVTFVITGSAAEPDFVALAVAVTTI
ncbi:DUF4245 domain-containing protein [Nakamurella silvestris]|nr:DUF4245 domain-containing protein [Nakamurella silvestris]